MGDAAAAGRERLAARFDLLAWLTVLAVAVVVPLVTVNPTILGIGTFPLTVDQVDLPRAVLLAVLAWAGLGAWAVSQWVHPTGVRWLNRWWLIGGFVGLVAVSALLSEYGPAVYPGRWFHYEGLLQFAAYAAVFFVAAQTATVPRVTSFVRLGALVGAVLSAYGIAQALGFDAANWLSLSWPGGRAFATWNNPDFFGGYLLFPLAFSIALAAGDADRRWRIAGIVSLGLTSVALVMTLTRGAWLAGLLAAVLMLACLGRRGFPWKRTLVVAAVVLTLVLAASYVATDGRIASRALDSFKAGDDGVGGRLDIWRITMPYALKWPVLGTGPDTYSELMLREFAGGPVLAPNDPHNIVLYLLVTLGVPAALAFLGFLGLVLARTARVALSRRDGARSLPMAALWCVGIAYSANLLLTVSIAASMTLLFACLGILSAAGLPKTTRAARSVPRIAAVAAVALLVVSGFLGVRGLSADHAYLNARNAPRDSAERVEWAGKAVALNPWNEQYVSELTKAASYR